MQTPLGCAKAKGAGREENILAGGARGRWRSRGREWTSWRDQNLEDPVKFLEESSFLNLFILKSRGQKSHSSQFTFTF